MVAGPPTRGCRSERWRRQRRRLGARRRIVAGALLLAFVVVSAACSNGTNTSSATTDTSAAPSSTTTSAATAPTNASVPLCPPGSGAGSPGVSSSTINVASIATQSGPLAGDFLAMVPGVKAYFDYVDCTGGVNGRKIELATTLDDQSNPSQFSPLLHTALEQDHAFALVGVATPFFDAGLLTQNCTPTYGYNVTGNWSGPPNLYSSSGGGSASTTHKFPTTPPIS